jgi:hypothetical protein
VKIAARRAGQVGNEPPFWLPTVITARAVPGISLSEHSEATCDMFHFSAPGRDDSLVEKSPAAKWGTFTEYLEVGNDDRVLRAVLLFKTGQMLRYDRGHWADGYARMPGLRFSKKPKWRTFFPDAETITAATFEKTWASAMRSPIWELQLASSRMAEWGPFVAS